MKLLGQCQESKAKGGYFEEAKTAVFLPHNVMTKIS